MIKEILDYATEVYNSAPPVFWKAMGVYWTGTTTLAVDNILKARKFSKELLEEKLSR